MNFGDNTHGAVKRLNELGWADYLVQIHSSGFNSIIVLRLPADVLKAAQDLKRVW
jgi:hypothetical protein